MHILIQILKSARRWAIPAVACACTRAAGNPPSPAPGDVTTTIRARLDSLHAHGTFYAKSLATGKEIAVRADEPMNTASVIKIPVMILAFRDADAGTLDLAERYPVRAEDVRGGTGLLRTFAAGVQPTTLDLITQMIITSDNTATDIMIAKVGGVARVNRFLDSLGFRETRLQMTVADVFRAQQQYRPALADTSASARSMAFVLDPTQWLGRTTAREISRLLERIERGELASQRATGDMRRILRAQLYASRLPQRVRFQVTMGHKTGDWPPILGNDVGIMYAPSGPIVLAVFTNGNTGSFFDLEATEGRIAEDVLSAWGR